MNNIINKTKVFFGMAASELLKDLVGNIYWHVRDFYMTWKRCDVATPNHDYTKDVANICYGLDQIKENTVIKYITGALAAIKAPDIIEKPVAHSYKILGEVVAAPVSYVSSVLAEQIQYNTDYITYNAKGNHNLLSLKAVADFCFHSDIARLKGTYEFYDYGDDPFTLIFFATTMYHHGQEEKLNHAVSKLSVLAEKCKVVGCNKTEALDALAKYQTVDPSTIIAGDTIMLPLAFEVLRWRDGKLSPAGTPISIIKTVYKALFLPDFIESVDDIVTSSRKAIEHAVELSGEIEV